MNLNQNNRVLIVEDDQEINKLLQVILQKNGLGSVAAYSGTEGLLQLKNQAFDLVLLDLMLPGLSGEAFIEEALKSRSLPIIVISAKKDIEDKVHVLKIGADDYITKPFNQEEVMARIEVQLRKTNLSSQQSSCRSWREITVDVDKLTAAVSQTQLHLTNAEFDILSLLVENPEHAFSKREIYENVWKGTYVGDDNTISVHISNIRKKLAEVTPEEYIRTIWGIGFMLV